VSLAAARRHRLALCLWPLRGGIGRRFARPTFGGPPASGAPKVGADAVVRAFQRRWPWCQRDPDAPFRYQT
jgi:hypothetical protein